MSEIDLRRFTQICGMLGSDHDGERASAAALATKMLKAAGLTWADILGQLVDKEPGTPKDGEAKIKTRERDGIEAFELIKFCFENRNKCESDWDEEFVETLHRAVRRYGRNMLLSDKQWVQLFRIGNGIQKAMDGTP